jgi:hypothetical protein
MPPLASWALTPIPGGAAGIDHRAMVPFAIRCLPRVPVATEDLERWIEQELDELRLLAPRSTIRLSRLTQDLPSIEVGIGWLIELELPDDQTLFESKGLARLVRDLRLLGLQPTLLVPPRASGGPNKRTMSVP